MPRPKSAHPKMNIALKEWAVVIEAIVGGRQSFLLRKGGIAEGRRGFELKHKEFLFYPTWEHQQETLLQEEFQPLFRQIEPANPGHLEFRHGATVSEVLPAPPIERLLALNQHYIWAEPYIRMRYEYRPDLPLYLVFVEPWQLPAKVLIPYDRRYAGCRSWVELYGDVDVSAATPPPASQTVANRRKKLLKTLAEA